MRDRDKLVLMIISVPLLLLLQMFKFTYTDWLSMMLCYVGLVLILGSFTFLPEVFLVSKWPSVEGKITTSEIANRGSHSTERRIYAKIQYTYSVNGVEYTADRFRLGVQDIVDSSDKWVKETIEKYPLDKTVSVFYSPNKPGKAVLERGLNVRIFGFTLLGLLFYVIGLIIGGIWLSATSGV